MTLGVARIRSAADADHSSSSQLWRVRPRVPHRAAPACLTERAPRHCRRPVPLRAEGAHPAIDGRCSRCSGDRIRSSRAKVDQDEPCVSEPAASGPAGSAPNCKHHRAPALPCAMREKRARHTHADLTSADHAVKAGLTLRIRLIESVPAPAGRKPKQERETSGVASSRTSPRGRCGRPPARRSNHGGDRPDGDGRSTRQPFRLEVVSAA